MTLKFETLANVGDHIRAFDFKPMSDRGDCYVIGVVTEKGVSHFGALGYMIRVTVDVFDGKPAIAQASRVGDEVFVPYQVAVMEYDERIQIVATA